MTEEWTPPADIKPWIVCAACRMGEYVIAAPRHMDVTMRNQIATFDSAWDISHNHTWEQGFIDQWGRFYSRTEAMTTVRDSGQPFNTERNGGDGVTLYSEGLY